MPDPFNQRDSSLCMQLDAVHGKLEGHGRVWEEEWDP